MFQGGLVDSVFVGAMGPGKPSWTPTRTPRPNSLRMPGAHQTPGARGEPVPDWFGCSQPCPAGREALRSITPELTQISAFR